MRNLVLVVAALLVAIIACGGSGSSEQAGMACMNAGQCYAMLDAAALKGTVTCLTKYPFR